MPALYLAAQEQEQSEREIMEAGKEKHMNGSSGEGEGGEGEGGEGAGGEGAGGGGAGVE